MSKPPRYETSYPGQLSLLPSAGWEMSTSESAVMLCGCGITAGVAHSMIPFVDARVGGR